MEHFIEATVSIDLSFEECSDFLSSDVEKLFDDIPTAGPRGDGLQTVLSIDLGAGATVRQKVTLDVGRPRSTPGALVRNVAWRATGHGRYLPRFSGQLKALPDGSRTKLCLGGVYTVPLGVVGRLGDSVLGHRLAAQSLQTLIESVGARVERELGPRRTSWLRPDAERIGAEHSEIYIG